MYVYVASPYTHKDHTEMQDRYLEARRYTASLLVNGKWAFSPIVHCHDIAVDEVLPRDITYWRHYNAAMLAPAKELHVLQLDGWEKSEGVFFEIEFAQMLQKPIHYARWDRGLEIYRLV